MPRDLSTRVPRAGDAGVVEEHIGAEGGIVQDGAGVVEGGAVAEGELSVGVWGAASSVEVELEVVEVVVVVGEGGGSGASIA